MPDKCRSQQIEDDDNSHKPGCIFGCFCPVAPFPAYEHPHCNRNENKQQRCNNIRRGNNEVCIGTRRPHLRTDLLRKFGCIQVQKNRHHEDRHDRRCRCHRDTERDRSLREIGEHIRSCSARQTSDQDERYRECGRKVQYDGKCESDKRHQSELRHKSDQYPARTSCYRTEVVDGETCAHAQHDDEYH